MAGRFTRLLGTSLGLFQLGFGGPKFIRNGDVAEVRDKNGDAFAIVRGARPVGAQDFTTKDYVDALAGGGVVTNYTFGVAYGKPITGPIDVPIDVAPHVIVDTSTLSVAPPVRFPSLLDPSVTNGQWIYLSNSTAPGNTALACVATPASGDTFNGSIPKQAIVPSSSGAWIADKTNRTWWRQDMDDVIRAQDYGVVADAISDDTAAMQRVFNLIPQLGGYVRIPMGNIRISSSLTISGKYGYRIEGDTGSGTKLMWGGNQTDPMILLTNCQYGRMAWLYFEAGNLNYAWQTHSQCAIRSHSATGTPPPTSLDFEDIHAIGYSPDHPGFDFGFRTTCDPGHDANNDGFTFTRCYLDSCTTAGWSFEHAQSRVHILRTCAASYCNYGVTTALGGGGSFSAYECQITHNLIDFYIGPPNEPILLQRNVSEGSSCFMVTTGQSSSPFSVTIDGCSFDGSEVPVYSTDPDGVKTGLVCWYSHMGPFIVRGGTNLGTGGNNHGVERMIVVADTNTNLVAQSTYVIENCLLVGDSATWGQDPTYGVLRSQSGHPLSDYGNISIANNEFYVYGVSASPYAYPSYVINRGGTWDVAIPHGLEADLPATPGWIGRQFVSTDAQVSRVAISHTVWLGSAHDTLVLCDYRTTQNNTTYDVLKTFQWRPSERNAPSYVLRAVVSATGGARARVWLHNLTTGTDVALNPSGDTDFLTDGVTPYEFTSQNLIGATGFSAGTAMYELRFSISDGAQAAIVGGSQIIAINAPQQVPTIGEWWRGDSNVANAGLANMAWTSRLSAKKFIKTGATPTPVSSLVTGREAIYFDATKALVSDVAIAYGTFTIFAVWTAPTHATLSMLFERSTGNGAAEEYLDTAGDYFVARNGGATICARFAFDVPVGGPIIASFDFDGAINDGVSGLTADGIYYPPVNIQGPPNTGVVTDVMYLGSRAGTQFFADMYLHEFIIQPTLSVAARQPFYRYLASRYANALII